MKDLHDFENLTIKEILVVYLGEEKAEVLLKTISQGIHDGLQGDKLNKLIYETLCKLSVTQIEVYQTLHVIPKIEPQVNPQVNPQINL
jgi:hypothetical protein